MAGGVEGVEGEFFVGPIGEQVDEFAAVEAVLHGEGEELGDAGASDAAADEGLRVGEQKPAGGFDGDDLAAAVELPLEWLTRDRVAVLEAMVAGKVGGLCRAAVFFQVGRCGYGNDAGLHSERDCCGIC